MGVGWVTPPFMVIPGCLHPLLGRDYFTKKGAQIYFGTKEVEVLHNTVPFHVLTLALEEEYKLLPQPVPSPSLLLQGFLAEVPKVWAEKYPMGLTFHQALFLVQIKAGVTSVRIRLYPMLREASTGISLMLTGSGKHRL